MTASRPLKHALFSALLVVAVAYPVLGLKLTTVGIRLEVHPTGAFTLWAIAGAALLMFVWQLGKDRLSPLLRRSAFVLIGLAVLNLGMLLSLGSGPWLAQMQTNLISNALLIPALLLIAHFNLHDKVSGTLSQPSVQRWLILGLLLVALVWPFFGSRSAVDIATLILIYIMLGLGLNIVVGLAGLLDLGYVGFYAVGAYTYALLAHYYGLGFWVCLPIAGLMAAFFGFILGFPVLRLRGDYLAIVTLGFGEIIRILLRNMTELTGGPDGISGIAKPTLFGLSFERRAAEGQQTFHQFFGLDYNSLHKVIFLYLVALLLVLVTLFVINRLMRMPLGRAWEALREDEIAARSLGLNPTTLKLSAFTLGASFAGFAGSFFAARQGLITPESFSFIESAIILAIVVLGGMGSQLGVILAAIVMILLPELMREFSQYRMLIFGALMVLMMIWRPQGLLPMQRPHLALKR
jgi:branched-chain amino acid transport system permease protein